ncbi:MULTISPECIES: hypothetical protein [Cobetia]|jgi:hypothetical protein|uniref:hypothetical protein n=1 Tax=Cobetia TaxID=204286 RepID=UPI0009879EC8|nr:MULTISPECIES: hypothetical protein [Cobetia]MDH2373552.1 hypothetical protein [Cobetia sp. 3AK]POR06270.1 hypothetical protein BOH68_09020 [Cobetia sp. MM1IDA2H-1]
MLTADIWTSALEHAVIAVIIQLMLWPVFTLWSSGAIAVAIFLGREIAQHEYKGGGPKAVAWDHGLLYHWNWDSSLDVALPLVSCVICASLVQAARHWRRRSA